MQIDLQYGNDKGRAPSMSVTKEDDADKHYAQNSIGDLRLPDPDYQTRIVMTRS